MGDESFGLRTVSPYLASPGTYVTYYVFFRFANVTNVISVLSPQLDTHLLVDLAGRVIAHQRTLLR